jgi:hypothetical protein
MRRGAIKWAMALALGAALAQPAWAGRIEASRGGQEAASLSRFWEGAATWFAAGWQAVLAEMTTDHGPLIDPDGATATAESDHGAMTDPNGAAAAANSDHGPLIDPNG